MSIPRSRPGGLVAALLVVLAAGRGAAAEEAGRQPIGEKPTAPSAGSVALREQGLLLGRGRATLELDLAYGHAERELAATPFQQQLATAQLALRYGPWENVQLSARLPWAFRRSATIAPGPADEHRGFGDVALGVAGVVAHEGVGRPNVLLSLDGIVPSGPGDAALGGGIAVTRSHDPVILFAGASYLGGLRTSAANPDRSLARHNFGLNAGIAFAVTEAVALNGQLVALIRSFPRGSLRAREQYRLQLGTTLLVTRGLFIEPSVSIAVGGAAPDLTLGLSVPVAL